MNIQGELIAELENTHRRMKLLFDDLDEARLTVPYQRGINPPVWELGHAAFFYEYFLLRKYHEPNPVMPGFDEIWDSFEIQHCSRWKPGVVPTKTATFDYYHRIIDSVRGLVTAPGLTEDGFYLTEYCIHHQNMHIESLIWARQTLGYPAPSSFEAPPEPAGIPQLSTINSPRDIAVPEGNYLIGIAPGSRIFSFDNERPGFEKTIAEFSIAERLVSKGDFLEFVRDPGGYSDSEHWSFGGKQWLEDQPQRPLAPLYWSEEDGEWFERFFDRRLPIDPALPAMHINYWEAEAYCHWAGRRLPTEYEWEAAARGSEQSLYPWGSKMDASRVDMDAKALGRMPVSAFAEGKSAKGCLQMLGTAWEWTSSQYLPYDGFVMDMYPYMSTLQFGDHKTTRGGSCATSSCLIRNTYRQAYLPGRSDVYVGFRTVPT